MNKKKWWIVPAAAGVYVLLLWLLVLAESGAANASIHTLPEALWFSLTTLTTVGYGDLYPVTTAGRLIGALFQLMSIGLLALLIGAAVALLRGKMLPLLKLRGSRRKDWFVFSGVTPASVALAKGLVKEDGGRLLLFLGEEDPPLGMRAPLPLEELCRRKKSGLHVFCMEPNRAENERLAQSLRDASCEVYCMTPYEPETLSAHEHRFDPYDACACLYWQRFPLRSPREKIVLVGSGHYAEALLEQALLRNVVSNTQKVRYRTYGDFRNFRRNHLYLSRVVSLNEEKGGRDSLYLSEQPWNEERSVLQKADRIIFCDDAEGRTLERISQLRRYCPVSGAVHARLSQPLDGVETFGSLEELYMPELVMQERLTRTARRLHEIYRAQSGGTAPAWEELSSFTRRSNLASADHLEVKMRILLEMDRQPASSGKKGKGRGPGAASQNAEPGIPSRDTEPAAFTPENCRKAYERFCAASDKERDALRRLEHERWMRFHLLNNWQYAPRRDNARRLHPMLVSFDKLSPEDQAKDDYAWELLETLAQQL